ncbi:hypothetical protein BABINDRAFT_160858 [Babjeviella inositovora NRRL Y-12698]|uniref:Ribonuclease T2-like n=1 Tax=Babjeviella inositovora NRRL Y-12698 TaxID=984486 RepID=A0A1E3QSF8_9ASCO|nr:uncharacterized protein BABINDRAFT_160858 [Babjeviella inositovora NRRL Y-12698]ODQ80600.1 hypothetical protein BABINDRAFT_160858 [Babjeviella inositovora NRRL Y-12698]
MQEVLSPAIHSLAADKCPLDTPLSCTNSTPVADSCCFEYPGGVLLQTQFWDYSPPIGPSDMFTLHGLWPDNCDGSFEQFCNNDLNIKNVREIMTRFNETELLAKMSHVWKNFNGNDELLWIHEFNKHGTCMSTINPQCYGNDYQKDQNVVDFFKISVELFERLPSYKWLEEAGIVPSETQTYSKQEIEKALSDKFGEDVRIGCNRYHALQEIWYFYHVQGSLLGKKFVPISPLAGSSCPNEGIKFMPKGWKAPAPTHTRPSQPVPTGDGTRGYIKLTNQRGCLISNGKWYASGSCAAFYVIKAPFGGYSLKSSKGFCGINGLGELTCNRFVDASQYQFLYDKELKLITYGGKDNWSAEKQPSKFKQIGVKPGNSGDIVFQLRFDAFGG